MILKECSIRIFQTLSQFNNDCSIRVYHYSVRSNYFIIRFDTTKMAPFPCNVPKCNMWLITQSESSV